MAREDQMPDNAAAVLHQVVDHLTYTNRGVLRGHAINRPGTLVAKRDFVALYTTLPIYYPNEMWTCQNEGAEVVLSWLLPITEEEWKLGRLPWSYDQIWRVYQKAAKAASIGSLSTHSLRHTFRTWLDSVGTPVGVQQRLMRHADIRTTMNVYGDALTQDMADAHGKVVRLAIPA